MRQFVLHEAQTVTVKKCVETKNSIGEKIPDWQSIGSIEAEIQPLSGEASRKEIGVTEKSTHRAFTVYPYSFTANTRLIDSKSNTYLVGYIADWSSHEEAILEKVVL